MKTHHNKNYMSIAFSVLTTRCVARNSGGATRKKSNPQSATFHTSIIMGIIKRQTT